MNRLCHEENLYELLIKRTKNQVFVIHEVFELFDRMHAGLTCGI